MALNTGETITIRVVFRDWEDDEDGFGSPIDPDTVEVNIYSGAEFETLETTQPAVKEDVGIYSYDFKSMSAGTFKVEFVGTFSDGSISKAGNEITVGSEGEKTFLGANQELVFLSDLSPLLVDPEELQLFYTEATLLEIAELIHRFSVEVQNLFGVLDEYPFVVYEYIRAAVECALFRTYGIGLAGVGEDFTLGDLSVSNNTKTRTGVTRGDAGTPCELAAAIRQEMARNARGMKAVVTGVNYKRKIPSRHLKHAERGF